MLTIHTVVDLIRLSPLLVDKDDCHKDDDLSHNAKEGPESSQATADTQGDLVTDGAKFIGSRANVGSNIILNAQLIDGQYGLVGGALDLISVTSAVENRLKQKMNLSMIK